MKSKGNYIIISTILFQGILILLFTSSILRAYSLEILKKNIPFINIVIIATTILIIISFKRLRLYEARQIELKLIKTNMEAVEKLITILRTERHDYIAHIQCIQALAYLEEYEELAEYVQGISTNYRVTNQMIRVGHPALTALLNSKREVAQEKGINFTINCRYKLDTISISAWELCSLVSNLIENAIEAACMTAGEKWIQFTIDYYENSYVLEIENTGQIDFELINILYEPGTSTKDSVARGYGLHICKKILEKYQGTIEFKNTHSNTVIFTVRLPRGEYNYDSKAI
ncbi:Sensor_kinase_SpoOB-type, alpha-helical domain [Anaerovirgula multivorans]|uniref:Sensor_kinase_SpoOB-type, alpha-helical domain n=1 Tax=Anaerovirgula multivorans TaxID=312168 RepID=A0A239KUX7_9FIRM|nr:GHKL domain-containing protein [Anaerovirgula multivorans]SNT22011.1 Sensor_kinase_SpoOB-type, alpha-helical domain [Anaerovirgula multivorans]